MRQLRDALRGELLEVVMLDLVWAAHKGVQHQLWREVFYGPITGFRNKITLAAKSADSAVKGRVRNTSGKTSRARVLASDRCLAEQPHCLVACSACIT